MALVLGLAVESGGGTCWCCEFEVSLRWGGGDVRGVWVDGSTEKKGEREECFVCKVQWVTYLQSVSLLGSEELMVVRLFHGIGFRGLRLSPLWGPYRHISSPC